jgi:hypothetical protein
MARRPRPAEERRPAKATRQAFARVLIVCEGEKTEPNYFDELRINLRLHTADVAIVGHGSSPRTLCDYAIDAAVRDGDFDYVFCVFDRDTHETYGEAVDRCKSKKLTRNSGEHVPLVAITSNPAFEYWLLLHFENTDKPYHASGRKSVGAHVLSDLEKAFCRFERTGYAKGSKGVFNLLLPRLPEAIKRAVSINSRELDNPHTLVVVLVNSLIAISEGKQPQLA